MTCKECIHYNVCEHHADELRSEGYIVVDFDNRSDAEKACKGFEQKIEWISVDERLPETDNENRHTFNVLVYIPEREGCRQHGMYLGKIRWARKL